MLDTTPITREITKLISQGTTSEQVLAVRLFPDIDARATIPVAPMCAGRR
jgi:hypothetical protein